MVPPSCVTQARHRWRAPGRIFMPLMSPGTMIFLVLEWNVPGIVQEGEAELHVLHLLAGVLAVPVVERAACRSLALEIMNGRFAGVDDREAAGLIAGTDIGDVGDAVARHVVMVERLAELLRRDRPCT